MITKESIDNKKISLIVISAWLILAGLYLLHTPQGQRNHDFGGHVEYSEILHSKHHFPTPHEGWQTYQPPLYYLINNALAPSIEKSKEAHIDFVRVLSVLYGAIALWLIADFLNGTGIPPIPRLVSLLFISTIPKFMFVFSTYNNDSLVTLLLIAMLSVTYKLYHTWSNKLALILLLIAVVAFYTKYTAALGVGTLMFLCCKNLLKGKSLSITELKILGILISSVILFFPWLSFHNYAHTKKYFPTNAENGLGIDLAINDDRPLLSTILRIPFLQQDPHEWDDPWAHGYSRPETKKHDYWAFSFLTSIFGEVAYDKPGISNFWALIWIHLFSIFIALKGVCKSGITRLAGSAILLGYLSQIKLMFSVPESHPAACAMDYRYVCWVWIAWAVLYAKAMSSESIWSWTLSRLLSVGIIIQIYVLMTMSGNAS